MSIEHREKQPSEEEKALASVQDLIERYKSYIQHDDDGPYFHLDDMREIARGEDNIKKAIEKFVWKVKLHNFPFRLPNSQGTAKRAELLNEQTEGRFSADVSSAIEETGIDKEVLGQYIDDISNQGLIMDAVDTKLHKELLFPIYIKLKEKGYTDTDLCN